MVKIKQEVTAHNNRPCPLLAKPPQVPVKSRDNAAIKKTKQESQPSLLKKKPLRVASATAPPPPSRSGENNAPATRLLGPSTKRSPDPSTVRPPAPRIKNDQLRNNTNVSSERNTAPGIRRPSNKPSASNPAHAAADKPRYAPIVASSKPKKTVRGKRKKKKKSKGKKSDIASSNLGSKHRLTECFSKIVGVNEATRSEAVKFLWVYIKQEGLQDSKDGRVVKLNKTLKSILGDDYDFVHLLNLPSLISKCFVQDTTSMPTTLLDMSCDMSKN